MNKDGDPNLMGNDDVRKEHGDGKPVATFKDEAHQVSVPTMIPTGQESSYDAAAKAATGVDATGVAPGKKSGRKPGEGY